MAITHLFTDPTPIGTLTDITLTIHGTRPIIRLVIIQAGPTIRGILLTTIATPVEPITLREAALYTVLAIQSAPSARRIVPIAAGCFTMGPSAIYTCM